VFVLSAVLKVVLLVVAARRPSVSLAPPRRHPFF
jgi:hypothetical protein